MIKKLWDELDNIRHDIGNARMAIRLLQIETNDLSNKLDDIVLKIDAEEQNVKKIDKR